MPKITEETSYRPVVTESVVSQEISIEDLSEELSALQKLIESRMHFGLN